jgi:hypothetical protein
VRKTAQKHGIEKGQGVDLANIRSIVRVVDRGLWTPQWSLHKFHEYRGRVYRAAHVKGLPIEYLLDNFELIGALRFPGNLLLNEGINELWTLLAGTGGTKFDNTNAYIGVGDSNAAADATQTGLQAATNKLYKAMDASYPTYGSSQKVTHRSTFGSGDANWVWNEITVANGGSDAAKNLNRKVQSMGTKVSGTSWVATQEVTLS